MAYKIAIIVGSLRKDSLNRRVARSICSIRGDNLDCSMIEIGDLPLYNQDLDADPPDQWVRLRDQIRAADGVLFVSPEYNRGIPGVLKNAIDVGSRPYGQSVFDKKPAASKSGGRGWTGKGTGKARNFDVACSRNNRPTTILRMASSCGCQRESQVNSIAYLPFSSLRPFMRVLWLLSPAAPHAPNPRPAPRASE